MSVVWKEWKIPKEGRGWRGFCALDVTVESHDSVDGKFIVVADPEYNSEGQGSWATLSLTQAKAVLAILPEAIALIEKQ